MKIYLNLATSAALAMLLSSCGENGKLKGILLNPEFTGGITSTKRPYTQTTDGSDQVLTTTKNKTAGQTPLNIENISVDRTQSKLQVSVTVNQQILTFEGESPSGLNSTSKLSRTDIKNSPDSFTLSCSDVQCPSTLIGNLSTSMGTAAVTMRSSTKAQARILYLSKHDAFEISSSFGPYFPAVPGFISQFQQSTQVNSTSYEVALGKAGAKIDLVWGDSHFCLETDVTTTDTGASPLTSVKITCGQDLLPKMKIDLVGNNQKGKLGFRFNIQDRSTFILFVDLNGKKISNPILPINPETLINPIGRGQRVFPENLKNPRTFNIIKQIYSDIPKESVTVAPEQSHGFEIVKKWLLKWKGEELDASSCEGGFGGKVKVQGIMKNFLKKAPPYFEKVKEQFYKADVPTSFMFTTLVESPKFYNKYSEIQVSVDQAVGPWQLLKDVAAEWGLEVFPIVDGKADPRDERGDFEKASGAAILEYDRLLGYFAEADYKLAIASYNNGVGNVLSSILNAVDLKEYEEFFSKIPNRKNEEKPLNYSTKPENYKERIEKNRSEIDNPRIQLSSIARRWAEKIPNYWFLHEFHMMPCETRDYVPKLVSAMIVGEDPTTFGY
ncbi:MAG: hypothetical protein A4S09_12790 [Proteobacteria bacterium SG_bin7]|nr:MAG: hypothetical protein A4S09_12790 [Proteobacteria bacterium SG_bin7]